MTSDSMNRVEKWLDELGTPALPVPGFEIEPGRTAVVITDPQNDFLHPDGVAWGACGESATENNTVANLTTLMETAIAANELICTEHSHKYTVGGFARTAAKVGLTLRREWTDDKRRFAVLHFAIIE